MPQPQGNTVITPSPDHAIHHEMSSTCLIGKIFGDHIPKHIIEGNLRRSWPFIRGEVLLLPMGNAWFLLTFTNADDKNHVWETRPWFIQDLNFVLILWSPKFCPYTTSILTIDPSPSNAILVR